MTPPRSPEREDRSPEATSGGGSDGTTGLRWKAALTAAFLLVLGIVLGIAIDRLWLTSGHVDRPPLTAEAMAEELELTASEEARVREVLDSLETEISEAAGMGPDSLHSAARRARQRLERALPPDTRPEFRQWMERHHRRMMKEMHGRGPGHGDGTRPMGRDSGHIMMRPPRGPHLDSGRDSTVAPGRLMVAPRRPFSVRELLSCGHSTARHVGA